MPSCPIENGSAPAALLPPEHESSIAAARAPADAHIFRVARFVHIRNALDHSADPATAIVEAIRVLRRGGVLYCNHFRNEAEREGYRGFHQFNIDEEDGHMILWNRGMRVDVNRMTEGFAEVEVSRTAGGRIVAVLDKVKAWAGRKQK